jgi:hypothetical protein
MCCLRPALYYSLQLVTSTRVVYFNKDANWQHVCRKCRQAIHLWVAMQVAL